MGEVWVRRLSHSPIPSRQELLDTVLGVSMRGRIFGWAAGAAAILCVVGVAGLKAAPAAKPEAVVGKKVADFRLMDGTRNLLTLAEFADRKVIVLVFTGTGCPIANSYAAPLSQL